MVGESLTGLTVKTKDTDVSFVPSSTVIVIVVLPLWLSPGVMVTVRLALLPCKLILAFGTKETLEEEAVTVNKLTGVSASPIVNEIGPVGVLSAVDCGSMELMVGG